MDGPWSNLVSLWGQLVSSGSGGSQIVCQCWVDHVGATFVHVCRILIQAGSPDADRWGKCAHRSGSFTAIVEKTELNAERVSFNSSFG
jgi:hypothetical protein